MSDERVACDPRAVLVWSVVVMALTVCENVANT